MSSAKTRQHPITGYLLRASSFGVGSLAAAIFAALLFFFYRIYLRCGFQLDVRNFLQLDEAPMIFLTLLVLLAAVPIYKRAQRHLVPLADSTMKSDTRRPIIFLRSFSQDSDMSSEEEGLRNALKSFGPFVAIGNPKDELPPLGASRLYVTDAEWQDRVKALIGDASLVVVVAGSTPGLAWEISQVRALVDPSRLLIVVPNSDRAYREFRSIVENNTDIVLPEYPSQEREKNLRVSGLIRLNRTWVGLFQSIPKGYDWKARSTLDKTTREPFIILEIVRKNREIGHALGILAEAIMGIFVLAIMVAQISNSCRGPTAPASHETSVGDGLRSYPGDMPR
jgi:hypothetical protein